MEVITHLSYQLNDGYFLWLNDRIDIINAANINASNTDTAPIDTLGLPICGFITAIVSLRVAICLL